MSSKKSVLSEYLNFMKYYQGFQIQGRVIQMIGDLVEAYNPGCSVGSLCSLYNPNDQTSVLAEVVGFKGDRILLMPLGHLQNVHPRCRVLVEEQRLTIPVGMALLGRVLDPMLNPIDDQGPLMLDEIIPLTPEVMNPLRRPRITEPLDVGIRSINGCLTCGKGQRIGILAGSGVGKSVLLGMMARYTTADVNVIALIGERGREVKEFIEKNLGEEGMQRSVVIVATSDQPPLLRIRGAFVATAIAEYFRNQGKDVLLTMDSVTRFAMAKREVGLASGEPPTSKGYPPSIFSLLPKLLERTGTSDSGGSITGFYTVLVEGDDPNDPIGDAVRAIVDGHIVLSRSIAGKGHFPAIDILLSASRVMNEVISLSHKKIARILRSALATYKESEDLINIGAYVKGSNPEVDYAIAKHRMLQEFLRQDVEERSSMREAEAQLYQILGDHPSLKR